MKSTKNETLPIKKYKTFCNVPDNTIGYHRDHNGCYNIYNPLIHKSISGSIEHTIKFLKHLFGGKATADKDILGDPFTVALDYLTLMYQNPKQILPVVCLVSPERNTGKSTFLKWLKDIYGTNATILGNEQFKMNFNSHYITKFIIGIDEGFIELEKKSEAERLKKLATDETQWLEYKGVDPKEIHFYGKLIICSNDADNLMKIDEGEIRFFVIRVKPFEKEDPSFREKLKAEIPAFLYFLKNRKVFHPREGRAWFHPKYLETEQLRKIQKMTKNRVERVIDEFMEDLFLTFGLPTIKMPIKGLLEKINQFARFKIDRTDIKRYLKQKKGISKMESCSRGEYPGYFDHQTGNIAYIDFHDRYYKFKVEDWLNEEMMQEFEQNKQDKDKSVPF